MASCRVGDSVAEIGVNGASCHIGASNLIPQLLRPLQDSRRYESGQDAGGGEHDGGGELKVRRWFHELLSLYPRPPQAASAQLRTGTPDAADGRGRSSGPGCAAHAGPSPGDWSMVSAPTRSPLCGLPRLIGSLVSQESVHNRNAE